ncbi:MAG: DUF262 domain-containing protein [Paraclostridium sp.]
MSYETAKTIKSIVEDINANKYLLPSIQREFVWSTNQIEKLFDSLMRDYPINSFLFWEVRGEGVQSYKFYEFLREYHEVKSHNQLANTIGKDEIIAILDGQQRLTSIYIGLTGTYAYKLPRKRYDNPNAYPKRKLYVNILSKANDEEKEYDFKFLTDEEASIENNETYWFLVSDILNFKQPYEINNFIFSKEILRQGNMQFASEVLFKLQNVICEKATISYYLEKNQDLDRVLDIFIRINAGGTKLSYSDLLLSIATAQWSSLNARESIIEVVDKVNSIGNGFNIDKDFILKSALVLADIKDIAFKVKNFNKENMENIELKWNDITNSIVLAFQLINTFGYDRENLTANNAIIPIAYYLYSNGYNNTFIESKNFKEDRKNIKEWLAKSLIKRIFSSEVDNTLRALRNIIKENREQFPLSKIIDDFRGRSKTIVFTDEDIDNLLYTKYGNAHTFSILQILYPTFDFKNKFHVDHIHAKSIFTNKKLKTLGVDEIDVDFYKDTVNNLANLQLLEGQVNIEKNDKEFDKWIDETFNDDTLKNEYIKKHYIPNVSLNITNFKEFIEKRNNIIKIELLTNLK